jgi:hypothetical protein
VYVPEIPGMSRTYDFKPSRFDLPYENVPLISQDGTNVHGWLIRPAGIPHNPGECLPCERNSERTWRTATCSASP